MHLMKFNLFLQLFHFPDIHFFFFFFRFSSITFLSHPCEGVKMENTEMVKLCHIFYIDFNATIMWERCIESHSQCQFSLYFNYPFSEIFFLPFTQSLRNGGISFFLWSTLENGILWVFMFSSTFSVGCMENNFIYIFFFALDIQFTYRCLEKFTLARVW